MSLIQEIKDTPSKHWLILIFIILLYIYLFVIHSDPSSYHCDPGIPGLLNPDYECATDISP